MENEIKKQAQLLTYRQMSLRQQAWNIGRLQGRIIGAGLASLFLGAGILNDRLTDYNMSLPYTIAILVVGFLLCFYGYWRESTFRREFLSTKK